MNISVQLAVLVTAACLCLSEGAPDVRLTRKQQRPTRGFKNVEMMTARGFGKRDHPTRSEQSEGYAPIQRIYKPRSLMVANGFGKRDGDETVGEVPSVYGQDNFWESLEATPERDSQESDEKTIESVPVDWFVNEMLNNHDFARSVIRKFIDLNQDGVLTSEELLRNVI